MAETKVRECIPESTSESVPESVKNHLESLMEELLTQQQRKVLETARVRVPHLTAEDILNPHDYAELMMDPIFNYEEGIAAGLMTAQMAIRARLLRSNILRGKGEHLEK